MHWTLITEWGFYLYVIPMIAALLMWGGGIREQIDSNDSGWMAGWNPNTHYLWPSFIPAVNICVVIAGIVRIIWVTALQPLFKQKRRYY